MEECRAVSLYVYQWLADHLPPPIIKGRETVTPISAGGKHFLQIVCIWQCLAAFVIECFLHTAMCYTVIPTKKDISMLNLDQIRKELSDRRPSMVAEATGLHVNTVRQVRDNEDCNPTYKIIKALSDYLESRQ
jgi:hypothetical protein